jgi:hypothetical protein
MAETGVRFEPWSPCAVRAFLSAGEEHFTGTNPNVEQRAGTVFFFCEQLPQDDLIGFTAIIVMFDPLYLGAYLTWIKGIILGAL